MNSRKNKTTRKLSFQGLEERQMMAANVLATPVAAANVPAIVSTQATTHAQTPVGQVTASLNKGVLTITGVSGNDAVTITQPANSPNELVLTSSNGTLLNNYSSLDFKGVTGAVNITFKGTSASLTIGTGSLVSIPGNLNVNMSNGNNVFAMYDTTVKGSMTLNGGSSHDSANIQESTIGVPSVNGGANDLTIMLGAGGNGLVLENNVHVERDLNVLDPSSGSDEIIMKESISAGRYVYINTGNGNDTVTLAGVTAGSQLNLQTAGGNDQVFLGGEGLGDIDPIVADTVYLDLGAGNDALKIGGDSKHEIGGGVFAHHGTTYKGGAGTDDIWNESFNPLAGVSGFETNYKI